MKLTWERALEHLARYEAIQRHLKQAYAGFDDEIEAATRATIESSPEFQPMSQWQDAFAARLDGEG